jgi:hypothetical protein
MRLIATIIGASLITAVMVCQSQANAQSAGEMLRTCKGVLDAKPGSKPGEVAIATTYENGQCWGHFRTYQQLSGLHFSSDKHPALNLCVPEQVTLTQWISIFAKHVNDNPTEMHVEWWLMVYRALAAQWGCEK